jgi:5-methylcytosine-specific restriction endonuclease McrA
MNITKAELINQANNFLSEYLKTETADKMRRIKQAKLACNITGTKVKIPALNVRFKVMYRDDFKCVYCGRGANDGAVLQIDHIKPKSKGGVDEFDNYVTACQDCNYGKRDMLLELSEIKRIANKQITQTTDTQSDKVF